MNIKKLHKIWYCLCEIHFSINNCILIFLPKNGYFINLLDDRNMVFTYNVRHVLFFAISLIALQSWASTPVLLKLLEEKDYIGAKQYLVSLVDTIGIANRVPEQQADLLCTLCEINLLLNVHGEAKSYGLRALEISKNIQNDDLSTKIKLCIAATQTDNLEIDNKLRFYQETQKYVEMRKDPWLTRLWHNRFGYFLITVGESEEAIFHLKKSYQISKKNDFDVGFINDALNLSMAYIAVGKLDRSPRLLLEALDKANHIKDSIWITKSHLALGFYYTIRAEIHNASVHFESAKEVATRKGYSELLGLISMNIELNKRNYNRVIELGYEAKRRIELIPRSFAGFYLDSLLYLAYKGIDKPAEALIHLEQYQSFNSLMREQRYKSLLIENKYF